MRSGSWIVVLLGAAALAAGGAAFLRRHFDRPELVVCANSFYRNTEADRRALRAGLELAAQERDGRTGGLRLRVVETRDLSAGGGFPAVALFECFEIPVWGCWGVVVRDAQGAPRVLERPCHPGDEGVLVADRLRDLGVRRVAWIADEETPTTASNHPSAFLERACLNGVQVVDVAHGPRASAALAASEAVYLDVSRAGAALVRELRAAGFRGRVFLTAFCLDEEPVEDGVEVVGCLRPAPPPDFVARFERPPHPFVWEAYREGRRVLQSLDTAISVVEAHLQPYEPVSDAPIPPAFYRIEGGRLVAVSAP